MRSSQAQEMAGLIYNFRNHAFATDQSDTSIHRLLQYVADTSPKTDEIFSDDELGAIQEAFLALGAKLPNGKMSGKSGSIKWFPEFGCVLLFDAVEVDYSRILLIALDNWRLEPSRDSMNNEQSSAVSLDSSVLHCGHWPTGVAEMEQLAALCDQRIATTSKEDGFQRTPAFIHSIVEQVLDQCEYKPRGGTTDVGRHTGSSERSTVWPLVSRALEWQLDHHPLLHCKLCLHFDFVMFEEMMQQNTGITRDDVKCLMAVIDEAVTKVLSLRERGYDASSFVPQIEGARRVFDERIRAFSDSVVSRFQLPASVKDPLPLTVEKAAQADSNSASSAASFEDIRKEEIQNIGWLPALRPLSELARKPFRQIKKWLNIIQHRRKTPSVDCDQADLFMLCSIDRVLFESAKQHLRPNKHESQPMISDTEELEALAFVVDTYQQILNSVLTSSAQRVRMYARLRSHELLVCWIACCLMYEFCSSIHRLLASYSLPLESSNLQFLVSDDRMAVDACLAVGAYIDNISQPSRKMVFTTQDSPATSEFAREFAKDNPSMMQRFETEQEEAKNRENQHLNQVMKKKMKVREHEEKILDIERKLEDCQDYHERRWLSDSLYHERSALSRALKAPSIVINPLPEAEDLALPVVFYLMMPRALESFARFCFLAQSMLNPRLPCPHISEKKLKSMNEFMTRHSGEETTWAMHYNDYSDTSSVPEREVVFYPISFAMKPPHPPSVDRISVLSHKEKCTWYPDSETAIRHKSFVDPFRCKENWSQRFFTEHFDCSQANLQWALSCPTPGGSQDPPTDRGNRSVAEQAKCRPSNFSKRGFNVFGSLRSFPHQQFRKLANAFRERSMPLENPAVHTLIRQTAYHFGPIRKHDPYSLEWRRDLFNHGVQQTLLNDLHHLKEELQEKPRDHRSLQIVAEIASFISQWTPDASQEQLSDLVRDLATISTKRADQALDELEKGVTNDGTNSTASSSHAEDYRASECRSTMYALFCFGLGGMSAEDAIEYSKTLLRFRNTFSLSQSVGNDQRKSMQSLEEQANYVCARRSNDLVRLANTSERLLTASVQHIFNRAPDSLIWSQVKIKGDTETTCFKATGYEVDGSKNHYMVNVATGVVLKNGLPPGCLPAIVLGNKLYQRSFGKRNFEVSVTPCRSIFKTTRKLAGFNYDFQVASASGQVTVIEIAEGDDPIKLELIDLSGSSKEGGWTSALPTRLHQLHSHWFCERLDTIVLRPISFEKKQIHYVVALDGRGAHLVPPHWRNRSLHFLLEHIGELSKVLRVPDSITTVLEKFEERTFIEALSLPKPQPSEEQDKRALFDVRLPRFNLGFRVLSSGSNNLCFHSCEHTGFSLDWSQQLSDLLPFFTQYLVLKCNPGSAGVQRKLLLPAVSLTAPDCWCNSQCCKRSSNTGRLVELCSNANAVFRTHVVSEHPRLKQFYAETIHSRLHLAAVFASSGTTVPEPYLRMTAAEAAIGLVRNSWTNAPLSSLELQALTDVAAHADSEPALRIVCQGLLMSSKRLKFLYQDTEAQPGGSAANEEERFKAPPVEICTPRQARDSETWYEERIRDRFERNSLRRFVSGPEASLQSTRHRQERPLQDWALDSISFDLSDKSCFYREFVKQSEIKIESMISLSEGVDSLSIPPFPLNESNDVELEREMCAELRESWERFHRHGTVSIKLDKKCIDELFLETTKRRKDVEGQLEAGLTKMPQQHSITFKLLFQANRVPSLTPADLLRIGAGTLGSAASERGSVALELNPFLNKSGVERIGAAARTYMELCVLEDKLERLQHLGRSPSFQPQLEVELRTRRVWDSDNHPLWLAFEVEQRLQIRSMQYVIAQHLLKNPGAITQLNMGLGKTRVVLPMLIMHWSGQQGLMPRVHFLQALLEEGRQCLHSTLTASSVLRIPIFQQPFTRDVALSHMQVRLLRAHMERCERQNGVMVLAPGHRTSLMLKWHEVRRAKSKTAEVQYDAVESELRSLLEYSDQSCRNVFDESDALLHYKYQLVYAVGAPLALPEAELRTSVIHGVLGVLGSSSGVGRLLQDSKLASAAALVDSGDSVLDGAFRPFTLLPVASSDDDKERRQRFRSEVAEAIVQNPPHCLRWISQCSEATQKLIKEAVTDQNKALTDYAFEDDSLSSREPKWQQLLILRGMLALLVLEHCLGLRHRVNYGLADSVDGHKKRMAVPFRAADYPAERAEFSHPDVCLTLTTMAYYYSGLTLKQLGEAISCLLGLSPSAQEHHYDRWICPILQSDSLESEEDKAAVRSVDNVSKVDLSNDMQLATLYRFLRFSVEAINFWLLNCVVCNDMTQYPQKLLSSAWHLPSGEHGGVGFSGTNDNKRLLPSSCGIRQHEPESYELLATNGMMLHRILQTASVEQLTSGEGDGPLWQSILRLSSTKNLHALIDTGALLAGVKLEDAANFLLEHCALPDAFQGVLFFDTNEGSNGDWKMLNRMTKFVELKKTSTILERDAFVIFDEARCRGSDMKLQTHARAAITLSQGLGKDKFMQGAGRLRQLGPQGQKLLILCPHEISLSIEQGRKKFRDEGEEEDGSLRVVDVLQWVMKNTRTATVKGLSEWSGHGAYYGTTKDEPDRALMDEDWTLEKLYQQSLSWMSLKDRIQHQLRFYEQRISVQVSQKCLDLCGNLAKIGKCFGSDIKVQASYHDEECEREICEEQEEQEEAETETSDCQPNKEAAWNYEAALSARSAEGLSSLEKWMISHMVPRELGSEVHWSEDPKRPRVFFTDNFWQTVKGVEEGASYNEFLRMVDALLLFQDGSVLLLSDREAEGILCAILDNDRQQQSLVRFVNLLRLSERSDSIPMALGPDIGLNQWDLSAIELFSGETMFREGESLDALKGMLAEASARRAIPELIKARGRMPYWFFSQVAEVCEIGVADRH